MNENAPIEIEALVDPDGDRRPRQAGTTAPRKVRGWALIYRSRRAIARLRARLINAVKAAIARLKHELANGWDRSNCEQRLARAREILERLRPEQ